MLLVLEVDLGLLELSKALDEAFLVGVDQNVGDGRVFQQRLDWPKAGHFIDDLIPEGLQLTLIKRNVFAPNIVSDIVADDADELLARHLLQIREVELIDD